MAKDQWYVKHVRDDTKQKITLWALEHRLELADALDLLIDLQRERERLDDGVAPATERSNREQSGTDRRSTGVAAQDPAHREHRYE